MIVWGAEPVLKHSFTTALADVETWRLAFVIVMLAAALTSGLWLPLVDAALIR